MKEEENIIDIDSYSTPTKKDKQRIASQASFESDGSSYQHKSDRRVINSDGKSDSHALIEKSAEVDSNKDSENLLDYD